MPPRPPRAQPPHAARSPRAPRAPQPYAPPARNPTRPQARNPARAAPYHAPRARSPARRLPATPARPRAPQPRPPATPARPQHPRAPRPATPPALRPQPHARDTRAPRARSPARPRARNTHAPHARDTHAPRAVSTCFFRVLVYDGTTMLPGGPAAVRRCSMTQSTEAAQPRAIVVQDISCVGRCSLTVALPVLSAAGGEYRRGAHGAAEHPHGRIYRLYPPRPERPASAHRAAYRNAGPAF